MVRGVVCLLATCNVNSYKEKYVGININPNFVYFVSRLHWDATTASEKLHFTWTKTAILVCINKTTISCLRH